MYPIVIYIINQFKILRDTTVQSLTIQATVINGVLQYDDSPLVKAVKEGLVLVIDEADKAPLHVISVLKSLLDFGVLHLTDGRVIRPSLKNVINNKEETIRKFFFLFYILKLTSF